MPTYTVVTIDIIVLKYYIKFWVRQCKPDEKVCSPCWVVVFIVVINTKAAIAVILSKNIGEIIPPF